MRIVDGALRLDDAPDTGDFPGASREVDPDEFFFADKVEIAYDCGDLLCARTE